MEIVLTPDTVVLLLSAGLLAGFIDSIAGGGGLITLPVLLFLGLPPQIALGTNKLQGSFGTFSASLNYLRRGQVEIKTCVLGIVFTFLGAAIGSWTVQMLGPGFLRHIIPFLLLLVLLYTFFSPNLGQKERAPKVSFFQFFSFFGLLLGFYDGFFGPGTGALDVYKRQGSCDYLV